MKCDSFKLANSIQISFVLCGFESSISVYQGIRLLLIFLPHLSTPHFILRFFMFLFFVLDYRSFVYLLNQRD
jgi:hypothetical protein